MGKVKGLWICLGMIIAMACQEADIDSGDPNGSDGPRRDAGDDDAGDNLDTDSSGEPGAVCGAYDGLDILVVIDNSGSMSEEQRLLSTGFFTLINGLTRPVANMAQGDFDNVRLAVVTSDMGLQYGEDGDISGVQAVNSCEALRGDDGEFQTVPDMQTTINVPDGVIACEEDGGQCPAEFSCTNGVCTAPGGVTTVNCVIGDDSVFSVTGDDGDINGIATQAACLAAQGTDGCGVEQQLQASVRGLDRNSDFIVDSHLLAVMVISDEEDCSVEDNGLYNTPEWQSGPGEHLNTACNYPQENNDFLFEPAHFSDTWAAMKGGNSDAVVFVAIVGVPVGNTCEGAGDDLGDCLNDPDMQLRLGEFTTADGNPYTHFVPACTRTVGNVNVTTARPGRRYVSIANEMGANAYVSSICNADWRPAMEGVVRIVRRTAAQGCEE